PGDLEGDEHLDHEFVSRRRDELGWGAEPVGELLGPGGGDPVPLLLLRLFALPLGLDEPVPPEALKGRVDLADVKRPYLPRPRFELVLQPQPVLRPVPQQGEEGMRDTHRDPRKMNILSMYTRYARVTQVVGPRLAAHAPGGGRVRKRPSAGEAPLPPLGCGCHYFVKQPCDPAPPSTMNTSHVPFAGTLARAGSVGMKRAITTTAVAK